MREDSELSAKISFIRVISVPLNRTRLPDYALALWEAGRCVLFVIPGKLTTKGAKYALRQLRMKE